MPLRVFVDANILYSRTLRDWLFLIPLQSNIYSLHCTDDVIREALHNLRKNNPRAGGNLTQALNERWHELFDEVFNDFPPQPAHEGVSSEDIHVHGAVLHCRADALITTNVKDFCEAENLNYELYSPDNFLCLADDSNPDATRAATTRQLQYWSDKAQKQPVKPLPEALNHAGCPQFAQRVEAHLITMQL